MADAGFLQLESGVEPASAPSGFFRIYVDVADNHLKYKDENGNVTNIEDPSTAAEIAIEPSIPGLLAVQVRDAIVELLTTKLNVSHAGAGGGAHSLVSSSQAGFMSSSDKDKLDSIDAMTYVGIIDNVISSNVTVPTNKTWLRTSDTEILSSAIIDLQGNSTLHII